jgi:prepilin-type N-terminal cleavage/methylation domain-containing protein
LKKEHILGCCDVGRAGFSLIEVSLSLMILTLGLLAIFHLFPSGLTESSRAHSESRVGLFADEVLGAYRAETMTSTNWSDWVSMFQEGRSVGIGFNEGVEIKIGSEHWNSSGAIAYPDATGNEKLRYKLDCTVTGAMATVELWVKDGIIGGDSYKFIGGYFFRGM